MLTFLIHSENFPSFCKDTDFNFPELHACLGHKYKCFTQLSGFWDFFARTTCKIFEKFLSRKAQKSINVYSIEREIISTFWIYLHLFSIVLQSHFSFRAALNFLMRDHKSVKANLGIALFCFWKAFQNQFSGFKSINYR